MKITVLGGTGFAGSAIVLEAAARGHAVTSVSRSEPAELPAEATWLPADLAASPASVVEGADVVVAALSPRGGLADALQDVYRRVADDVAGRGKRLIVVGGFSSLRPAPGEPRFIDAGSMPGDGPMPPAEALQAMLHEAAQMNGVLQALLARTDDLDWTFLSPGMGFGSHVPGERTGSYRLGGDVALFDADGQSAVSGADFAIAVLDEVERHEHSREHIGVAY